MEQTYLIACSKINKRGELFKQSPFEFIVIIKRVTIHLVKMR